MLVSCAIVESLIPSLNTRYPSVQLVIASWESPTDGGVCGNIIEQPCLTSGGRESWMMVGLFCLDLNPAFKKSP